jgi:prepilin signal peptidase PulO-like enzyme (type II secretory pathway)
MALCVGVNAGINFRILGVAPGIRLAPLEKLLPVLWLGFTINAITGTILVMQDASTKLRNPDFYMKMVFIAIALVILRKTQKGVFRDPLIEKGQFSTSAKTLAVLSLFFWLAAITAGRLLAYVGPVSGLG